MDDKTENVNFSSMVKSSPNKQMSLDLQTEASISSPFSKQKNKDAFLKASQPISPQILAMQQSGTQPGGDSMARRNSLAHLCNKTDQMYHRKDQKKIKMEEFAVDIEFKFGVPMIILDLIHALTGYDIIS